LGKVRPPKRKDGEPPLHPDLVLLGHYADGVRCAILAVLVNGTFLSLFYFSHFWILIATGTAIPYVRQRILQREAALAASNQPLAMLTNNAAPSRDRRIAPSRGLVRRRAT